jgi:ketosteroid isomerase-like protein
MRRLAGVVTVIVLSALLPALAAPAEDEIQAIEKSWGAAVVANDYDKIDSLLAPGLIYAHSSGVVESKAEYMARLRSGAQRYETIDHQKIAVRVYGDTAVAHSHVRMAGKSDVRMFDDKLMMMHFWVKSNGRWQLAAHQTTLLP